MRLCTTFLLIALAAVASADITLRFWKKPCGEGDEVQCAAPGEDARYCCQSGKPFCVTADCVGCRDGNDLYSFTSNSCGGNPLNACREPRCCVGAGSGNNCAVMMELGAGGKGLGPQDGGNSTVSKQKCQARYPHKMIFADGKGERHEIFMQLGTMDKAYELYEAENWDELLKEFPKYSISPSHAQRHSTNAYQPVRSITIHNLTQSLKLDKRWKRGVRQPAMARN
jgi:hypothetical protein